MFVVFVSEDMSNEHGGPAKSVPSLARICSQHSLKNVILSTYKNKVPNNEIIDRYGLNHTPCTYIGPKKARFSISLFIEIIKILKREKNVILHLNNLWNFPTLCCYLISLVFNVPLIVSPRGAIETWSLKQRSLLKRFASFLFQKSMFNRSYMHVTALDELKALKSYNSYKKSFCIPNGVSVEKEKNVNKFERFTFLFMSRLHEKKGLKELLEAWKVFIELNINSPQSPRLLIAGTGDESYKNSLIMFLQENDLTESVEFVGMLEGEEKTNIIERSHVFVLPTYSENFGIAIAEAAERKLPIITTKGAPWQLIERYNCGWWIDLSVDNLVSALNSSFASSNLEELGENARTMVLDNYSWDCVSEQYLNMYKEVFSESRAL